MDLIDQASKKRPPRMNQNPIHYALQLHQAGRLDDAQYIYDQILVSNPRHPDALHLRGLIALQSGDANTAAEYLRKAAQTQPKNGLFRADLASALMAIGDLDGAESAFRRAAHLAPDQPQFNVGIANCLALRGRPAEAEKQLRAVTQRHPRYALAWFNLANTARDQGRAREAVELYRQAIALDPGQIEARNNLGATLLALAKMGDAEETYREALHISPDDTRLLCNLASVLIDRGKFVEAETVGRRVITLAPKMANAYAFLGAAIGHQGRLLEALEVHRTAAALEPDNTRTLVALGSALYETGHAEEGIPLLQHALELAPDLWQARISLGTVNLALGNFVEGWKGYYHRMGRATFSKQHPGVPIASSLPAMLAGKHICLLNEQGLGDQLFLLRWLPALKAQGVTISYRPDPKLETMLRRSTSLDHWITTTDALPEADFHVMLGDLPFFLSGRAESKTQQPCPASLPLTSLAENLRAMREQLSKLGPPPYIGITWRGGTPPEEQSSAMSWMLFKEVPMAQLAGALSEVEGTLIALQRKPGAGEIDQLSKLLQRPLHDLSGTNEHLENMLALLTLLDEYIGVSNTNVHLRAAVGRTARVLVPCPAEWRWMASGEESPWFPRSAVYRQKNDGDWTMALQRLAADLMPAAQPATG